MLPVVIAPDNHRGGGAAAGTTTTAAGGGCVVVVGGSARAGSGGTAFLVCRRTASTRTRASSRTHTHDGPLAIATCAGTKRAGRLPCWGVTTLSGAADRECGIVMGGGSEGWLGSGVSEDGGFLPETRTRVRSDLRRRDWLRVSIASRACIFSLSCAVSGRKRGSAPADSGIPVQSPAPPGTRARKP